MNKVEGGWRMIPNFRPPTCSQASMHICMYTTHTDMNMENKQERLRPAHT